MDTYFIIHQHVKHFY